MVVGSTRGDPQAATAAKRCRARPRSSLFSPLRLLLNKRCLQTGAAERRYFSEILFCQPTTDGLVQRMHRPVLLV